MKHLNNISDILIKPYITEKTYEQMENNAYAFVVHKKATKTDIKEAIETIFSESNAKVGKINIMNVRRSKKKLGKSEGHKASYKKAIIYLKDGSIPIFGHDEKQKTKKDKKPMRRRILTDNILEGKK